jgi:hypothetical protein
MSEYRYRYPDDKTKLVGIRLDREQIARLHEIAGKRTAERGWTVKHTDVMRDCIRRAQDLDMYDNKKRITNNYIKIEKAGLDELFLEKAGYSCILKILQIDNPCRLDYLVDMSNYLVNGYKSNTPLLSLLSKGSILSDRQTKMGKKENKDKKLVFVRLDRKIIPELDDIADRQMYWQGKTVLYTDIMRDCVSRADDLERYDKKMTIINNYVTITYAGHKDLFFEKSGLSSIIDVMQIDDLSELERLVGISHYLAYDYKSDDDTSDDDTSDNTYYDWFFTDNT